MADTPKREAVWVHHAQSGRTQRVSADAWDAGELTADGWLLATQEQVDIVFPPPPAAAADGERRSARRRT